MFFFYYHVSLLFLMIGSKSVIGKCVKLSIVTCDNLLDVQYNKTKESWTELLIESDSDNSPDYILSTDQMDRNLSNLELLIITKQFREVEDGAFFNLRNLEYLVLYGNNFQIIKTRTFTRFNQLLKLKMINNKISYVEPLAFKQSYIGTIDLSHNKLSTLNSGAFYECYLTKLIIRHNQLSRIESNSLPNTLRFLYLDHNDFKYFFSSKLGELDQLEELSVSHNKLFIVVEDLTPFTSLARIDFSHNEIFDVRDIFNNLTQLYHLDLSNNLLGSFEFTSPLIANMGEVFSIFLANNGLRNLHLPYSRKTRLLITLAGNPWNCKCIEEIEEDIKKSRRRIWRTECDEEVSKYGKIPYCVVKDSYYENCSDETISEARFNLFQRMTFEHNKCPSAVVVSEEYQDAVDALIQFKKDASL